MSAEGLALTAGGWGGLVQPIRVGGGKNQINAGFVGGSNAKEDAQSGIVFSITDA